MKAWMIESFYMYDTLKGKYNSMVAITLEEDIAKRMKKDIEKRSDIFYVNVIQYNIIEEWYS